MTLFFCIAGFVLGFLAGLFLVSLMMSDEERKIYTEDRKTKLKYGAIVWLSAGVGVIWGLVLQRLIS